MLTGTLPLPSSHVRRRLPSWVTQPSRWPVASSTEDLFRDDWVLALRADRIRRPDEPDEEPFRRLVLEHPGAVGRRWRWTTTSGCCACGSTAIPPRRRFVELPAGLCDVDGEDPLEVARRELREEAGLEAGEWTR